MSAYKLLVCTNSRFNPKNKSCGGQGSEALLKKIKQISARDDNRYVIEEIKCFGQCEQGPVMRIAPALEFFFAVSESDLDAIHAKLLAVNLTP